MPELAVVTGASSGIGQAYAGRLARDGWDLLIVARRRERLDDLARRLTDEHGVNVRAYPADLSRHEDVDGLATELETLAVGMLVNNAALAYYKPFEELPPGEAGELVHLNVLAPLLLSRAAIPEMRRRSQGAIINVASLLAFSGTWDNPHMPRRAVYAASKSFLLTFTQILAGELTGSGIRVQVVCPGMVRSEFHSRQGLDLSSVPRMEPEAIFEPSLSDLERGQTVSLPGVDDETVLERLAAVEAELISATRTVEPAGRYQRAPRPGAG